MEIKTVSLEIETVSKEQKLLPGLNMTQEELIARIRKAEEGPFYALDEGFEMMRKWREARRKQTD